MTLRLKGSTSGHTEVKAPASAGSNTLTLPTSNGSAEQFLKNSGTAGELEFSSMVETSTGVGIGTASPTRDLEVSKAGSAFIRAINTTNSVNIDVLAGTSAAFVGPQSNHPLAFQTNNTERLRIDSSGNLTAYSGSTNGNYFVIRGKHSPGNEYNRSEVRFGVENNANGLGFLAFATGNNTASERLRIDSSGRVGIGTSSPANKLHVSDTSGSAQIRITGSSGSSNIYADSNIYFQPNGSTAVTLASSGNVGIGTTPQRHLHIHESASATVGMMLTNGGTGTANDSQGFQLKVGSDTHAEVAQMENSNLRFLTNAQERMRIDSSGRVLIGSSAVQAHPNMDDLQLGNGSGNRGLTISSGTSGYGTLAFGDSADSSGNDRYSGSIEYYHADNSMRFYVNIGERMRIDSSGRVKCEAGYLYVQNSASGTGNTDGLALISDDNADKYIWNYENTSLRFGTNSQEGMRLDSSGRLLVGMTNTADEAPLQVTKSPGNCLFLNRGTNDGTIAKFATNGTTQGSISVSGSTVSYNGAHLSRWSQLAAGAARTEILRGSVLSNLDEMCEWGEENNEQLNRMKVSDVEGDKNVSGVFQSWDDDDDTYVNDFHCAMTGDFVIRIAQGTTVARGDLLMSAGDGTAKPQDDDIVRSKTIAKVTSTTVSTTYSDNSYCVPCVLMAC